MALKGTIGILTGGGDVPGLNPAIRAVTFRAIREGYKVIAFRRGWAGLVDYIPDSKADNSENILELSKELVNRAGRTGGTFIHTSRTNPSKLVKGAVPDHLKEKYNDDVNDVTEDMLKNLEFLGIDYLIPIGGDDTLSYGHRLHKEGIKVVAIPKTMDNDVPAPIIVLDSVPASQGLSRWSICYEPLQVRMKDFWSLKYSGGMLVLHPCFLPWQEQLTDVLFLNILSTWKNSLS
jgi:6-phosphofructokinase